MGFLDNPRWVKSDDRRIKEERRYLAGRMAVIWAEHSYMAGGVGLYGRRSSVTLPDESGYLSRICNKKSGLT